MQEEFLHHVWKYQRFDKLLSLRTQQEEILEIIKTGQHNIAYSGPDFLNARLKIGNHVWAGHVEIHIKASDWYAHRHEEDPNYDNVILHVVWESDVEIYRNNRELIPCLELKELIDHQTKINYDTLVGRVAKTFNCENSFEFFDDFTLNNWFDRLYLERLEDKTGVISSILEQNNSHWEDALFKLLFKNFGLNKNGDAFFDIAYQLGYKTVLKHQNNLKDLESLLLGTSGLLEIDTEDSYINDLKSKYYYLSHKYNLKASKFKPDFFRLRPDNFPSLRLAQLAKLYHNTPQLFQALIRAKTKKEIYDYFQFDLGPFWNDRYSLTKISPSKKKKLSTSFIDLLIINTIIPIKFYYEKQKGEVDFEALFNIMKELKAEKNSKVNVFEKIRPQTNTSAFNSQALLHLKTNYCDKNYCLKCHLGQKLINQSV
jgi:hypothetical protein